ncbi:hypothetical protein [Tenacibaculum ovolyticum]|uniref:hypothetical protein n=1 Tax=Tenacibaculum ovolyticum TaxID=104270 RepID=UPI0007EE134D|nr:hypothetical protein [Tenacibaculum ovolyticum]
MRNKFVKILIIINGIIIPVFILILLTDFLSSKFERNKFTQPEIELNNKNNKIPEFKEYTQYSSIQKIPNSENFIVAKYLIHNNEKTYGDYELTLPYTVPERTVNLYFLDKNYDLIGKLLKKDSSIKRMFISQSNKQTKNTEKHLKYLSFLIAKEDSNKDGLINKYDKHQVYVCDLNNKNLTMVTEREINQFQWISEGKELLIQFEEKDKTGSQTLSYGIYDIQNNKMRLPKLTE